MICERNRSSMFYIYLAFYVQNNYRKYYVQNVLLQNTSMCNKNRFINIFTNTINFALLFVSRVQIKSWAG
jgi:hypothetical protein